MSKASKSAIPLRRSLRLRVGWLVTGGVLLAGLVFALFGLRPTVMRIAEDQFSLAARQVETSLDRLFQPAERILLTSHGWLGGKAPDLADPGVFNRLYRPVLDSLPQATSVVAGASDGSGWMLLNLGDGAWRNRMTNLEDWGQNNLFFEFKPGDGDSRYWQLLDYDPRQRAWYKVAIDKAQGVQWTAPYTFFTTGDPGVTAASHLKLDDGRDFVIGIDLSLRGLSQRTMGAKVGQRGFALVLTDDLRVLALPAPPVGMDAAVWQGKVLQRADELGLAPLKAALADKAVTARGGSTSFRLDGEEWLISSTPYALGDQRLWVVSLAPLIDFIPDWHPMALALSLGVFVMLLAATVFSRDQARRIAQPLEVLAQRSERIGQLDFQDSPIEAFEYEEIGKLAAAQETMRTLLQGNQRQLAAKEDELREQIKELRATEAQLKESEARQRSLIRAMPDLVWMKDDKGVYLSCNPRFERFFGASEKDIIGRTDYDFVSQEQAEFFLERDQIAIARGVPTVNEEWITFADDGHRELLETTKTPLFDTNGKLTGVLGVGHNVTERAEHADQLKHIAHYDVLTTLPNRVLLADRLQQAIVHTDRKKGLLAVVYLDLDGFKAINDRHGHEAGDKLLVSLAIRMKQALREVDTLARLGGDEFVAVLLDLSDVESSKSLITRLLAAAAQPVAVDDLSLQVSASLGITFYPQADEVDADQLLRQADQAMYQAKLAGRNRYQIFDAEQDRSVRGYHESIEHIRTALGEGQFVLYYQPKVNMRTGRIVGAEALIRWQHPERGLLPPDAFLPTIENHPLAVDVGEWVIATALRQIERWQASGLEIPVSVNVGARQLQQGDFVDRLRQLLAEHPAVPADRLSMEVLETSALEDMARVSDVIESCRKFGVVFALDDFGTGYSSLTYLKRLSVNELKIDRSFVRDMLSDPDDLAILGGVLSLASAFHKQVIAEGVETNEHGAMLLQLGCDLAQGYGIARPMPGESIPGWAVSWRPDPSWATLAAVERNDLSLLLARVDHRAWVVAVESFLRGEGDLPVPHQYCAFCAWLDLEGLSRHGASEAFQTVVDAHRAMHALADELCHWHVQGRGPEALARLGEMSCLCNVVLEQISHVLMDKSA